MSPSLLLDRRSLLIGAGALALATAGGHAAFASASGERKFVLVILRGAMDGLAAAPVDDPNYRALRGRLALPASLPLSDGFGLHPNLKFLKAEWDAGRLAVLHAAASPYRDRSHFDGQDVLESGAAKVFAAPDGWMNRAVALLPGQANPNAVAIGGAIPLVLRGQAAVSSWAPSQTPAPLADTVMRLLDLYAGDDLLAPALQRAVATDAMVGKDQAMAAGGRGPGAYRTLTAAAAKLLATPGGPAGAVISLDGWDTHANQGAEQGVLALRLQGLDAALGALKDGLGDRWTKTVVIVATEFGRTVAMNGTGGTDHGTGGVAFALGGAVRGGRMLGDWPGLAQGRLHEGRDLAPVNDVRALFAAALRDHWGIDRAALAARVFPDSPRLRPFEGLVA